MAGAQNTDRKCIDDFALHDEFYAEVCCKEHR